MTERSEPKRRRIEPRPMGGHGGWSGYGGYGDGQIKEKFREDDSRSQGEAMVLGRQDDTKLKFPRCAKVWAKA